MVGLQELEKRLQSLVGGGKSVDKGLDVWKVW